jgi:hypothetical protein
MAVVTHETCRLDNNSLFSWFQGKIIRTEQDDDRSLSILAAVVLRHEAKVTIACFQILSYTLSWFNFASDSIENHRISFQI